MYHDPSSSDRPFYPRQRQQRPMRLGASLLLIVALFASFLIPTVPQANAAAPIFADNFDSGLTKWNASGLWHSEADSTTCGTLVAPFPSPTNAAYYGNVSCNYDVGANSGSLTLKSPIVIPAVGAQAITFHSYEQAEGNGSFDKRITEVSTNGGTSWIALGTGQIQNTWYVVTYDLTPYAGQSVLIRLRFDSVDSIGNNWFGWMIDDVTIGVDSNIPPINSVPGPQSTAFNTPLAFSSANGNAISVSDADAGGDEQVTLTITNGTLTFGGISGLTTVSIKTSLAVINNALNGLLFTPTPGFAGAANLTITTDDLANNNSGPAKTDTDIVVITVAKGDQTIDFTNPGSKTYGDANFALSAAASSGLPVSFSVISGPATVADGVVTITGASTVVVRAAQAGNASYNAAPDVDHSIIISPAALSISADAKVKYINTANPTLTASYNGFVNGENASVLDTPVSLTTTADTNSPVGNYPITAAGAADVNYTISYVEGNLEVTAKLVPTITWADPAAITYGTALDGTQLNATATLPMACKQEKVEQMGCAAQFISSGPGSFSYSPAAGTVLHAGNNQALNTIFTPTDTDTYAIVPATVHINVNPASLTITAANATKVYGAGLPEFTTSSEGLVNGDALAELETPLAVNSAADATSNVGAYPIVPTASDSDYTITIVDGTLSVTPALLSITANKQTKYVGRPNPELTASYSGFVNDDDETSLVPPVSLTTTADTDSPVGNYPITAAGAVNPNYTISYVEGNLEVTPKLIPVITWAAPTAITYGTALDATQLNADTTIPGTFSYSPAAGSVLNAGNSQTLEAVFTPTDTGTYVTVTKAVSIDVNPAMLTIMGNNASKLYGADLPTFSASSKELVNGDTLDNLDVPVSFTTLASAGSSVGDYSFTPVASDANYLIKIIDGTLSVTPVSLVITADPQIRYIGRSNPTLTASYAGFVNDDDDEHSLVPPASVTTAADINSPAGAYPIVVSGAINPNYIISFVNGTLIVSAKQIPVITWPNPAAITYGTGLSETQLNATASVAGTFSYSPAAGNVLNAGNSQALDVIFTPTDTATYAVTPKSVNINVLPQTLTITAANATKVYGAVLPPLTATATGFVNGDTLKSLDIPLTAGTTASAASNVGSYSIIPNAADANYTITAVNGTLSVTPAPLTITAANKTKHIGTANPTLTASYAGFVNGDNATSLVPPVSLTTTATTGSALGDYPITAAGAVNPNYTISFVAGKLTVTAKLVPTVTWINPAAITYGTALGAAQLNATASVPGTFSYTPAAAAMLNAGNSQSLGVVFTPTDSGTYASVEANIQIDVLRAALSITANDKTRSAGLANPELTATYTGFVNGDTIASLDAQAVLATTVIKSSPMGIYAITVSGASDANYAISFTQGTLTVTTYRFHMEIILT